MTERYVPLFSTALIPLICQTIDRVEDMVYERLEAWLKEQRKNELTRSIIYYRDGVGTGQYDTIKRVEVHAIREAYRKLADEKKTSTFSQHPSRSRRRRRRRQKTPHTLLPSPRI